MRQVAALGDGLGQIVHVVITWSFRRRALRPAVGALPLCGARGKVSAKLTKGGGRLR